MQKSCLSHNEICLLFISHLSILITMWHLTRLHRMACNTLQLTQISCVERWQKEGLMDQTWLCVYCWCQTPSGVVTPRRAITRAQPIIIWCHHFSTATNILLIKSNLKFESSATSLRCHVSTLSRWQVSELPPPPVAKMRVLVFCGRLGVWNRTAPDRRHLLPVATTKLIMWCI